MGIEKACGQVQYPLHFQAGDLRSEAFEESAEMKGRDRQIFNWRPSRPGRFHDIFRLFPWRVLICSLCSLYMDLAASRRDKNKLRVER